MVNTTKYGWKPGLPDYRDYPYSISKATAPKLPNSVDLRPKCPPIYDQGALGSCTANAIACSVEYEQMKQNDPGHFMPSRLFIYYNERLMMGTLNYDSGAYIRDGMKVVAKQGVCPESIWPYNIKSFRVKPSADAYKQASTHTSKIYMSVDQDITSIKTALANGDPVVFGFSVYTSFESKRVASTGIVPMPLRSERILGGHAVIIVGYDESKKMMLVRNSWGIKWGIKGYFWMPYNYVANPKLATDFWVIKSVNT